MELTDTELQKVILEASRNAIQGNILMMNGGGQGQGTHDAQQEAEYADDNFVGEEGDQDPDYANEISRIEAKGGRYITDAMMLKCATNS